MTVFLMKYKIKRRHGENDSNMAGIRIYSLRWRETRHGLVVMVHGIDQRNGCVNPSYTDFFKELINFSSILDIA